MRDFVSQGMVVASLLVTVAALARPAVLPAQPAANDALWQAYWRAGSRRDAAKEGGKLLKAGVTFDEAWLRLKHGRPYGKAPTGEQSVLLVAPGGLAYDNTIEVPAAYDPSRRWPVRVQLHGSVDLQNPEEGQRRRTNRLRGEPQIYVYPFGWSDSAWWHAPQVDNILTLVDRVKRQYNVDESQIYLTGTSDGGTGTYFLGMREPTVWASYLPLIGHMNVLANPDTGAEGDLFLSNLVNRPIFAVNNVHDPLYPAARVAPYIEALREAGASVIFRRQETGSHDTSFWDAERPLYERFVHDHPRVPHPAVLSWATERVDRYNRIQWLVIDALGTRPTDVPLADPNTVKMGSEPDFGLRSDPRKERGRSIAQVVQGSDAATMGLKVGDTIVAIDGRPVVDGAAIMAAFAASPGPQIAITVKRGAQSLTQTGPFPPQATPGAVRPLFRRRRPSGRVDIARTDNRFEARSRGVTRFTLLLSPDVVDFDRPIVVTVNGTTVHDGLVARDVATLLKWAARDNDRTMVYGAELPIDVP